jgi:DNA-binding transcriptional regulator LsrR (DeoR family)
VARADRRTKEEQLDRVAVMVKQGLGAPEIAERLGVRRPRASQLLMDLRAREARNGGSA